MKVGDWIMGLSYGAILMAAMAAAEGDKSSLGLLSSLSSLSPLSSLSSTQKTQSTQVFSEAEIPTDESIWSACCDHRDCMEAKIDVAYQAGDLAQVAQVKIGAYPVFELETAKIFHSTNGKSYFCRQDLTRPPDRENTRCVFYARPSYVRAGGSNLGGRQ